VAVADRSRISRVLVALLATVHLGFPRIAAAQQLFELARRAQIADSSGRYPEAMRLWRRVFAFNGGDPAPLYPLAQSAARAGERNAAFAALQHAIEHGLAVPGDVVATDPALQTLHGDRRWPALLAAIRCRAARRDTVLRAELLRLAERDQQHRVGVEGLVRRAGRGSREADSAEAALAAADAPLQARLKEIVRTRGWPGRRLVGDDGAHAAWLLLQHADSAYQRALLPVVQRAVQRGDARAADAALLEDRVRMTAGRPQRYGSALRSSPTPGAPPTLAPIEDEPCVDRRRAAVQLPPLADYLALFGVAYSPPSQACPH
jgi:hypothetical protein